MLNTEFAAKCKAVATGYKTVYMWGSIGGPVTESLISGRAAQYPSWYNAARLALFRSLIGKGYFAFDCVNLAKGILWGWDGDASAAHGGSNYLSNGVPDLSANEMIKHCIGVSTDFSGCIPVGAALWMEGHFGIYLGDGLGVECTPKWANGVQITAVGNIGKKSGYNTRVWTKWGWIPYVTYVSEELDAETKASINKLAQLGIIKTPDYWLKNTYKDQFLDDLFRKTAASITAAGSPCANVETAVNALVSAGIIMSPKYWLENYTSIEFEDKLLMAMGGAVKR